MPVFVKFEYVSFPIGWVYVHYHIFEMSLVQSGSIAVGSISGGPGLFASIDHTVQV